MSTIFTRGLQLSLGGLVLEFLFFPHVSTSGKGSLFSNSDCTWGGQKPPTKGPVDKINGKAKQQ